MRRAGWRRGRAGPSRGAQACRAETDRSWMRIASTIWAPTVITGFRAVMGSWKMMLIREPRSAPEVARTPPQQFAALEADRTADRHRRRKQAEHRPHGDALARTRFPPRCPEPRAGAPRGRPPRTRLSGPDGVMASTPTSRSSSSGSLMSASSDPGGRAARRRRNCSPGPRSGWRGPARPRSTNSRNRPRPPRSWRPIRDPADGRRGR